MKRIRIKQKRIYAVIATLLAGLSLTAFFSWYMLSNSFQIWQLNSIAEAERLSSELHYRVEREREPLISAAILYQGSEEVTQEELTEAHQQFINITHRDSRISLAFAQPNEQGEFIVRQAAGNLELLPEATGYPVPEAMVDTLAMAQQAAPELVVGALFSDNGTSYLSMALVSQNAGEPGILLALIDFGGILQRVTQDLLLEGTTLEVYHPATGDFNHASLPALPTSPEAEHQVAIDMGDYQWQLNWLFDADYAGYDNDSSFIVVMVIGLFISLLMAFALHQLLFQQDQIQLEVDSRTRELKATFRGLQRAQRQLIQQEKMASLGSLVAGIAHELNTPIGNSLMASSLIEDRVKKLQKKLKQGESLSTEEQEEFYKVLHEASHLMQQNSHRAADLINSFKQIAVDQTSDRKRPFDLKSYINEVFRTLEPMLKRTPHSVSLNLESDIEMLSYPGALGQVLNNLVTNTLAHAFTNMTAGEITLTAQRLKNDQVQISFKDNGAGMSKAVKARIFEPFFTTTLGKGGSGLGLHISYNLIENVLRGSIRVISSPNQGTEFIITLPANTPENAKNRENVA